MKHSLYSRLSKAQYIFGLCYLAAQQFMIPWLLVAGASLLKLPLTELWLNFSFFAFNFLMIAAVFGRYLRAELSRLFDRLLPTMGICAVGFVLYWVANWFVSLGIVLYFPDFSNANDANIRSMATDGYWLMFTGSVLLVPTVEETLYRGVVFGLADRFSRALAYALSTGLFALIHVIGYIGTMAPAMLLVSFLQYLPAGLCLCWAYAKSRTLFAPILIHTAVNLLGMAAMR